MGRATIVRDDNALRRTPGAWSVDEQRVGGTNGRRVRVGLEFPGAVFVTVLFVDDS